MTNHCIICYKGLETERDVSSKSREKCELFFKLLERYLNEPGDECFQPFPVWENIFDVGIPISCGACQGVMESFCELFHQMKSIELLINWKLWTLKNIMYSAQRVASRLNEFKQGIVHMKDGDGSSVEQLNLILNFKRDLIKNCRRKLLTTFPRLQLVKFQVEKDEPKQFQELVDDCVNISDMIITSASSSIIGAFQVTEINKSLMTLDVDETSPMDQGTEGQVAANAHIEFSSFSCVPTELTKTPEGRLRRKEKRSVKRKLLNLPNSSPLKKIRKRALARARHGRRNISTLRKAISAITIKNESAPTSLNAVEEQFNFSDCVPESTEKYVDAEVVDGIEMIPIPESEDLIEPGQNGGLDTLDNSATDYTIPISDIIVGVIQAENSLIILSSPTQCPPTPISRNSIPEKELREANSVKTEANPNNFSDQEAVSSIECTASTNFSDLTLAKTREATTEPGTELKKSVPTVTATQETEESPIRCLRSVHRCVKCMKTFSTPGRLLEHQRSHEMEDYLNSKSDKDRSSEMENSESDLNNSSDEDADNDSDFEEDADFLKNSDHIQPNDSESDDSEPEYYNENVINVDEEDLNEEAHGEDLELRSSQFTSEPHSESQIVDHSQMGCADYHAEYEINGHLQFAGKLECSSDDKGLFKNESDNIEPKTPTKNTCNICKTTVKQAYMKKHFKAHHNLKNLKDSDVKKCVQTGCSAYFLSSKQLRTHERNVHGIDKRPTTCTDCNKTFKSTSSLNDHYHRIHKHGLNHACSFENCDKRYTTHELLEGHIKAIHDQNLQLLQCPTCEKKCWGEQHLKQHLKSHLFVRQPQVFQCKVVNCKEKLLDKRQYGIHQKLHGKFTCFFCDVTKGYAVELAKHEIREHVQSSENVERSDEKGLKHEAIFSTCPRPNCSVNCRNEQECIRHLVTDHMKLQFIVGIKARHTCPVCKLTLSRRTCMSSHYNTFHNLKNLKGSDSDVKKCAQEGCSAYFLSLVQLRTHERSVHGIDERPTTCIDCNKTFKSTSNLNEHCNRMHKDELHNVCSFKNCDKRFKTNELLQGHIKAIHDQNLQLLQCPTCEKKCWGEQHLKHHLKSHSSVPELRKKYICEQCGKVFTEKKFLEVHYLSHSGPASWEFECSVCSKKCISQHKLDEHMRTHTKEKPFVCEICGVKYAHRHNLRIHVNNKHGSVTQDNPRKLNKANLTSRKGIKRKKVEEETLSESSCGSDSDDEN